MPAPAALAENGAVDSGRVAWLHIAPVKSMALTAVDSIELGVDGVSDNRRFMVVDADDHMVNGKRLGALVQVQPGWHATSATLTLVLPDGGRVSGTVALGESRAAVVFGGERRVRVVEGPWSAALSDWAGHPLRLVQPEAPGDGVDRTREAGATLLATASLQALAASMGESSVDPRRFRMLIGVDGIPAYAEDGWVSRRVRVGEATVLVHGNVGRCVVTTQHPDSGRVDLPTLRTLQRVRGEVETTEPLPFGVWAEVVQPGRVTLGDPCTVVD